MNTPKSPFSIRSLCIGSVMSLFLGLILGEATCAGIWLAIDYATGTVGNRLSFA